jgi:long-chain acyl-CoA synthetase
MSHVFGRMVAIACVRARVRIGHAASLDAQDLIADLAAFRPTFLLCIPYMLEKVFNNARAKAESGGRAALFDRAAKVAVRYGEALESRHAGTGPGPGAALRTARAIYDTLVYRRIRNAMGGRVRHIISGGSPLGRRLAAFYAGAGMEIYEGYGLTETTGAATVTPPLKPRLGTVGWPMPGTKVRIAADGEILLAGGQVFRGYWDPQGGGVIPASTDGWFPTGDIGRLDDEGYLTITGRKKEIIITAGGKNTAPAPLENWLRSHPLISQCMVVGDRRPYIAALLTLDMEGVSHWRRMNGKHPVPAELLVDDDDLRAVLQRAVDEANKLVSRPESIRRFAIVPRDFTEEEGHLTPSMKLRREVVMRDFAAEIESLYDR